MKKRGLLADFAVKLNRSGNGKMTEMKFSREIMK